jgi:hypothetical protein
MLEEQIDSTLNEARGDCEIVTRQRSDQLSYVPKIILNNLVVCRADEFELPFEQPT